MSDWQLEMGARLLDGGRVRFRVYAPVARVVELELYPWPGGVIDCHPMTRDSQGYWSTELDVPVETLYRYRLDESWGYSDPYSRSQPEDVHGPSQVIDPSFAWTDSGWRGAAPEKLVIYEMHVGTYTSAGTFDAVVPHLDALSNLGVTAIELMPVCEFPGMRNWGYDGAHRFAPESSYGGPEGLKQLVDGAHARGLAVLLDVVYNHLGPDGDYLTTFVPDVLTDRYHTPWGLAINFDGQESAFVRRYFTDNLLYWMHEFHIDGFRIDAAHEIYDQTDPHIIREFALAVHEQAPEGKRCLIMAEHERNELRVIAAPEVGGYGLNGMWVDDFHHSVYVRLTGEREGYLDAYQGTNEEIARLLNDGFLYCGMDGLQPGTGAGMASLQTLTYCLQNHDQVGNRAFGTRLAEIVGLELYKAVYALLLLLEETPLIFMGDEYAASTPFLYFTDHNAELAAKARAGRRAEFRAFWASRLKDGRELPDAQSGETFLASKLDWSQRDQQSHGGMLALMRELLSLRRNDIVFGRIGSTLRAEAASGDLVVVERNVGGQRRLLVVNFGAPGPLTRQGVWEPLLCTAEERFSGPRVELTTLRMENAELVELPAKSTTVWKSA